MAEERIAGNIGYYNLTDWWINAFDEKEKDHIITAYQPLGLGSNSLIKGDITETSQSKLSFLSTLATWFKKPEDYAIGKRIIEKAEEYVSETKDVLDIHFHYQNKLEIYYRNRETEDGNLEKAIHACEQQISISEKAAQAFKKEYPDSLPEHKGFTQLAIIREKQGDYKSAVEVCLTAQKQGWAGDWNNRIEKARKKIIE